MVFFYAFALTPATYILSWILHGGTYILFYMCLAEYVNKHVVKELKATGQMLNSVIQLSIGKIIGGMLGGLYAARFGFHNSFFAYGGNRGGVHGGFFIW